MALAEDPVAVLKDIELANIDDDPGNERSKEQLDLQELIASLKTLGLKERVRLYSLPSGRYTIASGHRRVAAARMLGWDTIPAHVEPPPSGYVDQAISRLASNLCRRDIDPISLATSVSLLHTEYSVPISQIAVWLGKSVSSIQGHLRLLNLPMSVRGMVQSGALSMGHALILLKIREPERDWFGEVVATADECQVRFAQEAVTENLSVKALETRVKNWLNNAEAIRQWLAKQELATRRESQPTSMAGHHNVVVELPPADDPGELRARRIAARAALRQALGFEDAEGPSLDHIRFVTMLLADTIYANYTSSPEDLPDHGTLIRHIERVHDVKELLNILGRLAAAVIIGDLNAYGTDLLGQGRTKWARGRFNVPGVLRSVLESTEHRI